MRSRVVAIIVAVVVPLVALGVVIARTGSDHRPARLPILAGGGAGTAADGVARPDAALYPYGGVVYRAGSGLPELGGAAHAYKVSAFDAGAALRLADALGLAGVEPDKNHTFTKGDEQLSVATSSAWGYVRQSSGGAGVSSSGVAVACAPDEDCPVPATTVPEHPADLPSQDDAKAIALSLLQRAGIDTTDAEVNVDDAITQWLVRIDPHVDGIPTEGFTTTVTVGENGVIEYANGVLGKPERADEYPLIGTSAAIDRLNKGEGFVGPRPLSAANGATAAAGSFAPDDVAPAPGSGGSSGAEPGSAGPIEPPSLPPCDASGAPTAPACASSGSTSPPAPPASDLPATVPPDTDTIPPPPPPQEITITGAERVLLFAASFTGDEGWLLPAYRLSTDQGVGPTVLAIDDSFLTPPDDVPVPKGSDGGAGSDGRGAPDDPGSSVTIEPSPAPVPTIEGSGSNG